MQNNSEILNLISNMGLKRAEQTDGKAYISIIVEGDCNDADYATEKTSFDLDDGDEVKMLKNSIKFIKNNRERLYKRLAILDDNVLRDEIMSNEYFELPRDYDGVCHTITSIIFEYTDRNGISYELEIA